MTLNTNQPIYSEEETLSAFSIYVKQLLAEKEWSMRELARQADVSHGLVANQLSGYVKISAKFCAKIAEPLGVPVDRLRRLAGLGVAPPKDSSVAEILEIANILPPLKKELLRQYAHFLYQADLSKFELPE